MAQWERIELTTEGSVVRIDTSIFNENSKITGGKIQIEQKLKPIDATFNKCML